jgi:hypothetical protein
VQFFTQPWEQNTAYAIGTGVKYNDTDYYCTTAHTSTTSFDSSKFRLLAQTDEYTSYLRDEVYRQNVFSVDLIEFDLPDGSKYLCSGPYDIQTDTLTSTGQTFTANGEFIQFGGVTEDFDVKVGKLTVNISGISLLAESFSDPRVTAQRATLYRCYLDLNTGAVVGYPIMLFNGQINNVTITESERSVTLSVDVASLFADFERTNGRKTNNDSNWRMQRFEFDTGFEKSGILKNSDILWGRTS